MARGRLPDFIYEPLPYIYLGAGVTCLGLFRDWISLTCGLTFVVVGSLVWLMRFQARQERKEMAILFRHNEAIDRGEDLPMEPLRAKPARKKPLEMPPQVFWSELYTCGNALLDAQHRSLMGKGNELMEAAQRGDDQDGLAILFDELTQEMLDHFIAEEALLAKAKHPLFSEHQGIHRELLARANQMRAEFESGSASVTALLRFAVHDLLAKHIVADDQRFLETDGAHR